jgi:hypothetical protein
MLFSGSAVLFSGVDTADRFWEQSSKVWQRPSFPDVEAEQRSSLPRHGYAELVTTAVASATLAEWSQLGAAGVAKP